jgi:hypothetical protein
MLFISPLFIRGGKKPLVVLSMSKTAEASGVVVPIPTCAILVKLTAISAAHNNNFLITYFSLIFICVFFLKILKARKHLF